MARLAALCGLSVASLALALLMLSQQRAHRPPPVPVQWQQQQQQQLQPQLAQSQQPTQQPLPPVSNGTASADEAVALQRARLARELISVRDVSGRELRHLVPERGGTPVRSLIATTWRSGSTFLGDILNAVPGNYYHYEPLLHLDIVQVRGPPLAERSIEIIKKLLVCDYTDMDEYLDYGRDHIWLFTHNERLWERCLDFPHLCWNATFLSKFCRLFPFQSMKIVRLRLKLLEDLFGDDPNGPRILLLVRDPRGVLQSRKHRAWCPGMPDCDQPSLLCADMVSDYVAAVKFAKLHPTRFKVLRYEDLSLDPYRTVSALLEFYGIDFHPAVRDFLDTHTKLDLGGVSSTFRNSKIAPFHWTKDLDFEEVWDIQNECQEAMSHWGYNMAHNQSHLASKEFNPLGEFSIV